MSPVFTYGSASVRASPRAKVLFPLPAAPSIATTRGAVITLPPIDRRAEGGRASERSPGRTRRRSPCPRPPRCRGRRGRSRRMPSPCGDRRARSRGRPRDRPPPPRDRRPRRRPARRATGCRRRGRETIGLLHTQLTRAQEPRVRRRVRGEGGEHGHLVDHERQLVGLDPHGIDARARRIHGCRRRARPALPATTSARSRHPIRAITSRNRVRVGLRPTSTIVIDEPVRAAAATKNAAEDGSPGTGAQNPSCWKRRTETERSCRSTGAPRAANARSVWSRVRTASCTVVVPPASTPASSTALLTCALGTDGVTTAPSSDPPSR